MKKFKLAAIAVLAASLCLTGCGGASNSNSASYKEEAGAAGDYAYESYAGESYAAEETAQMAEGEEYTADGGSTESGHLQNTDDWCDRYAHPRPCHHGRPCGRDRNRHHGRRACAPDAERCCEDREVSSLVSSIPFVAITECYGRASQASRCACATSR